MQNREIEELLELIWTLREENISKAQVVLDKTNERNPDKLLKKMQDTKLIYRENENIYFTPEGEKIAEIIIRRHRLAERLFSDVFQMDERTFEKEACTWEHVLSEEVTDSVCTFLGHPRVCPHNKPIPHGKCCRAYSRSVGPVIRALGDVEVGTNVKIVYILPSLQKRLERLTNLGIIPGNIIHIKQKRPALVVTVEETTIALDKEVSMEIFVINKTNGT